MLDVELCVPRRGLLVEVALEVAAGERLALFGPSGSGKTTVLEAVAGLVPVARGRIALGGRLLTSAGAGAGRPVAVPPWQRGVVLVRQDPALFPHRDVQGNLGWAGRGVQRDRVEQLVDALGLRPLLHARPRDLSGGQAQRVALVRALSVRRSALLLDEPYQGLDASLRRDLTDIVAGEVVAGGLAGVLVAHELEEAQAFADRIAVIDAGRVLQVGSPAEVVRRPATRRAAELLGYRGFVGLPGSGPAGRVAAVHPERVLPGAHPGAGPVLAGHSGRCRPRGAGWEIDLVGAWGAVAVRVDEPVAAGSALTVTLADPPLYAEDGRLHDASPSAPTGKAPLRG